MQEKLKKFLKNQLFLLCIWVCFFGFLGIIHYIAEKGKNTDEIVIKSPHISKLKDAGSETPKAQ